MTIRSSTATATKTEGVLDTQDFKRTSMREARRDDCSLPKSSGEAVGTFDALSWKYSGTQENDVSWGSQGAQRSFHFIHPKLYGALPRRIVLPYDFTAWVKSDPGTILKRHVVDVKGFLSCVPRGTSQKTLSFLPRISLR